MASRREELASAADAASSAVELVHTFGKPTMTPIGTSHALSVLAANATIANAIGNRTSNGSGRTLILADAPAFSTSSPIHSIHRSALRTNETAISTPETAKPTATDRHAPRAACQTSPIPGVTLVRMPNA